MLGEVEQEKNLIDNMQAQFLKGSNANYFFFPNEQSTIINSSKFATVFWGAEVESKTKVVCKQLSPQLFDNQSARLKFIVESSVSLNHPGIVKTIDLIVEDYGIFLIQEFIPGHNLKNLIVSKKYLNYKYDLFFYRIIIKALEAVDAIHKAGLTHGDIKPSNIMVVDDKYGIDLKNPEVKIVDLGNIKPAFKTSELEAKSRTYNIMYGSPEQVLGFSEFVGDHSDIFSMGLVLFETIAKEPALNTSNPMFIKRFQSVVKIEQHYRIDNNLFEVIEKATVKPELIKSARNYSEVELKMKIVKSLDSRYQNVLQFRDDLIKLLK